MTQLNAFPRLRSVIFSAESSTHGRTMLSMDQSSALFCMVKQTNASSVVCSKLVLKIMKSKMPKGHLESKDDRSHSSGEKKVKMVVAASLGILILLCVTVTAGCFILKRRGTSTTTHEEVNLVPMSGHHHLNDDESGRD